jgi:nucleotide-binding universal stress UspA family protein
VKADLIVIGSHHPNWSTYLIGSNATKIVRHALCSVLVVRLPNAPTPSL